MTIGILMAYRWGVRVACRSKTDFAGLAGRGSEINKNSSDELRRDGLVGSRVITVEGCSGQSSTVFRDIGCRKIVFLISSAKVGWNSARIAELDSVETLTIWRHEELLYYAVQRPAEEVRYRKKTTAEKVNSLICDVKDATLDFVNIYAERNIILTILKEHVHLPQIPANANNGQKGILTNAITMSIELLVSRVLIGRLHDCERIAELTREGSGRPDWLKQMNWSCRKFLDWKR